MTATAFDDTTTFLERHPWATTEVDNPIKLLRELYAEHEALQAEHGELEATADHLRAQLAELEPDAIALTLEQITELLAIIRRLRDQEKISEFEYQAAKAIAKRVPEHRARSPR